MGDLQQDTRMSGGEGRYTMTLSPDWEIWGPNGGYMAAVALRAAGMEAAIRRPVSIACHFLAVARFEPVEIEVRPLQRGRRAESIHVAMTQDGRSILQAIVRTAVESDGYAHNFAKMPDVPPPSALKSFLDHWPDPPDTIPFWNNLDSRIIYPERIFNDTAAWPARLLEWYRFQPTPVFDDPFVDAARQVVLLDTFAWPASALPYAPATRRFQGVNMDVVAWFNEPARGSEWLLCEYDGISGHGGQMIANGRIWSPDGRLLASGGAQLLCVPIPDGSR
jgi:acyl-CoA thioesterase-2